jgi:hypothetical protein
MAGMAAGAGGAPLQPNQGGGADMAAAPAAALNLGGGAQMIATPPAAPNLVGVAGIAAAPAGAPNLGGGAGMLAAPGLPPAQHMFNIEEALEGPPLRRSQVGPFFF